MLNKKHFIKMHICKSIFRRRNLFLHKAFKANKTNKTNKVNKVNKMS